MFTRQRAEADSAVISAAKQESAAIDKQRIAEGRRKSMQRQELEATAARSCVALVVEVGSVLCRMDTDA